MGWWICFRSRGGTSPASIYGAGAGWKAQGAHPLAEYSRMFAPSGALLLKFQQCDKLSQPADGSLAESGISQSKINPGCSIQGCFVYFFCFFSLWEWGCDAVAQKSSGGCHCLLHLWDYSWDYFREKRSRMQQGWEAAHTTSETRGTLK